MQYTVHVPSISDNTKNFLDLDGLKNLVSENNMTFRYLHEQSNSFNVYGNEDDMTNFLNKIKQLEEHGVYCFDSTSVNSMRTHIANSSRLENHADSTNSSYFSSKDISQIYNINSNRTTRVGIAIIELGGGYKNQDLNTYWNYLGLSTKPNVYSISVDGASNSPGNDADTEVVLDIEVVGGICPCSNIYVYFAPNTDQGFYDAIHSAVYSTTHPVSVISISWGGPENQWDSQTIQAFNALFQEAANKGITVCAASGDSGSSDGEKVGNHVDFPASSPWVLACGGTNLVCPNRIYSSSTTTETVWGSIPNDGAAGGGFSTIFTRPSYQNSALNNISSTMRGVPDVCGNADPRSGWIIYINGSYVTVGGTSAVAPMWAAYLANIDFKKFLNPVLYNAYVSNSNVVHDIVKGSEGTYTATGGWDPASGLGSPNGSVLTSDLTNTSVQIPSPSPTKSYLPIGTCELI
jgi:kumamolisin